MNERRLFWYGAVLVAMAVSAVPAVAQDAAIGIQQSLDRPVELTVEDALIGEVFERLSATSGIRFVVDADTLGSLPYGDQTRLAVKLQNVTLRKALTPMLAPQALDWVIESDRIRIVPAEALYRMGRRATYDELLVLGRLQTGRLPAQAAGGDVLSQLRKLTGDEKLSLLFMPPIDAQAAMARAGRALPCSAIDWLDMLSHSDGAWYLQANKIVVLGAAAQVRRQLQKRVWLHYRNADLTDVLLSLARTGRVKLVLAPGVLKLVGEEIRTNFNLIASDATIAQALEIISGATGLKFTPTAEGISVTASEALTESAGSDSGPRSRTPFFVKMTVPGPDGLSMEVFLRADELPAGVQQAIQAARDRLIEKLRSHATTKPQPTTQPG